MANKIIRVVTRESDGSMRTRDYDSVDQLKEMHDQVGIDDCSTDLSLRGLPVFRGLVGPIPESKDIARYESPDVFEAMTKEWTKIVVKRRRRRKKAEINDAPIGAPVPAPMGLNATPSVSPTPLG